MTQEELNEFQKQWLNGPGLGRLWENTKKAFVGGLWDQSLIITDPDDFADFQTQARANLGLSRSTLISDLWAGRAQSDSDGNIIKQTYAHGLDISGNWLLLLDNQSTPAYLARVPLNAASGLLLLDSNAKIPLVHIPDSIMGQLTYGGTITAYTQGTDALTVSITTDAKAILEQKTGRTISGSTIYLVNTSTTSGANFNYADCKGMYFIWTDAALADHTGETARYRIWPSGGPRYQAGDWMISNDTEWDKVDNTDAVTGIKGARESVYRLGNVNLTPADLGALDLFMPNTTQTVQGNVEFAQNIWTLGGMAIYGYVDLDVYGGGGGGGISGSIIRDWADYVSTDDSQILGANLGIKSFQMSGRNFQVGYPDDDDDISWQTVFTLDENNIPNIGLSKINNAGELQKIQTLAGGSGTPNGILKRASDGSWSFDTNSYALASALNNYLPLSGGNMSGHINMTNSKRIIFNDGFIQFKMASLSNTELLLGPYTNNNNYLSYYNGLTWNKIWHSGNDGTGSGLDADKLDGYEASGLFESLTNDSDQLKIQIGNTSKLLTLDYAKKTSRMRTEIKANQEFVYRQSPQTIDADSLVINKFRGRTVVLNQKQVKPLNATATYFYANNVSFAYSNGVFSYLGLASGSNVNMYPQRPALISGHKYYSSVSVKATTANTQVDVNSARFNVGTEWRRCSLIDTSYGRGYFTLGDARTSGWDTIYFKDDMMCIDLTLMFGSGHEPSTAAEFEALFPDTYYPKNDGQLQNNDAKQFETVGFNKWDEELEQGYIDSSGQPVDADNSYRRSSNYIDALGSTSYFMKSPFGGKISFWDGNKKFISEINRTSSSFTTPSNCRYMKFWEWKSDGFGPYANNICINLSDPTKNNTYEPYRRIVTDLNLDDIQVKSHNIWDEEWEIGSLTSNGEKTNNTHYIRSRNYVPIKSNAEYYFKSGTNTGNSSNLFGAAYFDENKNFISVAFKTLGSSTVTNFTPPQGAFYMWFIFGDNSDVYVWTTYNNDICINESSSFNGQYEPHGILTINGLKQAGSVYDEIVRNKLVKRVGDVDLGTLNWNKNNNNVFFDNSSAFLSLIKSTTENVAANILCGRFETKTFTSILGRTSEGIAFFNAANGLIIYSSEYNSYSKEVFKTAMSGVMLNYALATPIEYELASPIPDTMPAGTTERIISDRLPVTPFACDMTYGANPKDILASAVPWDRVSGKPDTIEGYGIKDLKLKVDKATVTSTDDTILINQKIGDTDLYAQLTVNQGSNGPSFTLTVGKGDSSAPEIEETIEFATLTDADIDAICV